MRRLLLLVLVTAGSAPAQFALQGSGSHASLRGVAAVDGRTAWASGTGGTVLRTVDGGAHWTRCTTPTHADTLDFRAVQAFDAATALVMSSGTGDASRVYRTADGCRTWQLLLTNPDAPNGFFDGMVFRTRDNGWLLGDPVNGRLYLANTQDGGATWLQSRADSLRTDADSGAFAASNQSLLLLETGPLLAGVAAHLLRGVWPQCSQSTSYNDPGQCLDRIWFTAGQVPMAAGNTTSGVFALGQNGSTIVAVGGDYKMPDSSTGTAAWSDDEGATWHSSATPPHGYRSSVAFDPATRTWLTVGPNGTDLSRDDGRTWQPLRPTPGDAPGSDRNWNALALPWVVGADGRIGRLQSAPQPVR